jgi:hypothetical protein
VSIETFVDLAQIALFFSVECGALVTTILCKRSPHRLVFGRRGMSPHG